MNHRIELQDVFDFIRKCQHPITRRGVMADVSDDKLAALINKAVREHSIVISADSKWGNINGIMLCDIRHSQQMIYINAILTIEKDPSVFPQMLQIFHSSVYRKGFKVMAHRRGKMKDYTGTFQCAIKKSIGIGAAKSIT